MRTFQFIAAAVIVGAAGAYAWMRMPEALGRSLPGSASSFRSCDEARAAGKAPLLSGEPGYSARLDPDGDGVACDSARG
jgi:hypothetical protein